jgi:hypothetical protein
VGAWELLAAVTTTTTTSTTTTTLVQAADGQGGGQSMPIWVPLFAALLGAVVGGLLALYGSVLVNRWEVRRTARFRMYQELLPRIKNDTWPPFRWRGEGREEFEKSIDALMRAATVAGPLEWRDALLVEVYARRCTHKIANAHRSEDQMAILSQDIEEEAKRFNDALRKLDELIEKDIKQLWPRWPRLRQRLRDLGRKKPTQPRSGTEAPRNASK